MDFTVLLIFLVIGALAGWLAGIFIQGKSTDLLSNIIIGIVGAIAGGLLFGLLGFIGSILAAIAGAAVLLILVRVIVKFKNQS